MKRILILPKRFIQICNALSTLGKFIAFGFAFYLICLFALAYNSKEKGVAFMINQLGEANFEFYLMIGAGILILFWMIWSSMYVGDRQAPKKPIMVSPPGMMKTAVMTDKSNEDVKE